MRQRTPTQGVKPLSASKGADHGKGIFLPVLAVMGRQGDEGGFEGL